MNTDAEFPDTLVVSRIVFDDPRFVVSRSGSLATMRPWCPLVRDLFRHADRAAVTLICLLNLGGASCRLLQRN